MHDVESVVSDAAFWVALIVSMAASALVALRFRSGHVDPSVLTTATFACIVGLRVDAGLPGALYVGLGVLLLGEWVARDLHWSARAVAACPGALGLGAALPAGTPFWIRAVVTAGTVAGGVLVDDAFRRSPRLVPALLAIGALGVYACVPDTETPKVLVGALLGAALIGLDARATHGLGGTMVTGLFVEIAAFGGTGRTGAVVGGIACLGVVLLIPLVRWSASARIVVAAVVLQIVVTVFVARVAGFEESAWSALALSTAALAVAWSLLALVGRSR